MSFRSISLDGKVVAQMKELFQDLPKDYPYDHLLEASLSVLEGRVDPLASLQSTSSYDEDQVKLLTKVLSLFLWDCGKTSSASGKDISLVLLEDSLAKNNLNKHFIQAFRQFYSLQRRRLALVKKAMSMSTSSYHSSAWRIDVELSRRHMNTVTVPRFQLRLDLDVASSNNNNNHHHASSSSAEQCIFQHPVDDHNMMNNNDYSEYCTSSATLTSGDHIKSLHMTASYDNMRHLQVELEKAMDELEGVHAQRITRYIA